LIRSPEPPGGLCSQVAAADAATEKAQAEATNRLQLDRQKGAEKELLQQQKEKERMQLLKEKVRRAASDDQRGFQ
jgi:hypothetical protein